MIYSIHILYTLEFIYIICILFVYLDMFTIEHRLTSVESNAHITSVAKEDYNKITEERYWFNWKAETGYDVYKICKSGSSDILGLISLDKHPEESRIEIRLLAVSKENRGKERIFNKIVGNLIAYACYMAMEKYGILSCVSLKPKTILITHYMSKYGFKSAGMRLYIDGERMQDLIERYINERQ